MSKKLRKLILPIFSIVIIASLIYQVQFGWVSGYEGQGTYLTGYTASSFDSRYAQESLMFSGTPTRQFIDPDGKLKMGIITPDHGAGTGAQLELSQPIPVNYKNNQYRKTSYSGWDPSEDWEVSVQKTKYHVRVYRLMFGHTITTTTSRPDKGIHENEPISNLEIKIRIHLPEWKGIDKKASIGIGSVYIPKKDEMGAGLGDPVKTDVLGYKKRGLFDQLSTLGMDIDKNPYIAPLSPGVFLSGDEIASGTNPLGLSDTVDVYLNYASIKPGVQRVSLLELRRIEVTEKVQIVITFLSFRKLFTPSGSPGLDTAEGGEQQPPPICNFLEKPVKDSEGEILYCEPDKTMITIVLMVIAAVVVLVVMIGIKSIL